MIEARYVSYDNKGKINRSRKTTAWVADKGKPPSLCIAPAYEFYDYPEELTFHEITISLKDLIAELRKKGLI